MELPARTVSRELAKLKDDENMKTYMKLQKSFLKRILNMN